MAEEQRIYKVKFTPYRKVEGRIMYRQTAGRGLASLDGRYRFYIDEPVDKPDFWVVQGKGLSSPEKACLALENTILLTTEPQSVLVYPKRYTGQFGLFCTCQPQSRHPNAMLTPPVLPWFVGYTHNADGSYRISQDYDSLLNQPTPKKTKLISVITSDKAFTRGHINRIKFVEKLKAHYGDKIDIFGSGVRWFDDKWDVLAPYKYHIVIENSSEPYYWTEKLGDTFLAHTFPFYYGCTNVGDYFPRQAYEPIDIRNAEQAISIIDKQMESNRYEASQQALDESKRLVLTKWNLFEFIVQVCDTLNPNAPRQEVTLKPCRSTDNWHNTVNYTIKRNYYKMMYKFSKHRL